MLFNARNYIAPSECTLVSGTVFNNLKKQENIIITDKKIILAGESLCVIQTKKISSFHCFNDSSSYVGIWIYVNGKQDTIFYVNNNTLCTEILSTLSAILTVT